MYHIRALPSFTSYGRICNMKSCEWLPTSRYGKTCGPTKQSPINLYPHITVKLLLVSRTDYTMRIILFPLVLVVNIVTFISTIDGVRIGNWIYWHLLQLTINSYLQAIQRCRRFTKFIVHRYTRTTILSLRQSYPGNGIKTVSLWLNPQITPSFQRLASNSSSTTNFPWLYSVVFPWFLTLY
jgi:hypothetical protein